tara:strand:+ start:982 stop:1170 length:189 start_codon:yes stop_codon:yes gene_type:complete
MMETRSLEWFIEAIQNARTPSSVLKTWREAEEHLEVDDLVKIHAACHDKIVHSIKEVKDNDV